MFIVIKLVIAAKTGFKSPLSPENHLMNYDQLVCEAESGETFSLPSHGATGQQTRYTHKSHMNQIMKPPKQETFEQHNIYIYI